MKIEQYWPKLNWADLEKFVLANPDCLDDLFEDTSKSDRWAIVSDHGGNSDSPETYFRAMDALDAAHGGAWEEICNCKKRDLRWLIEDASIGVSRPALTPL